MREETKRQTAGSPECEYWGHSRDSPDSNLPVLDNEDGHDDDDHKDIEVVVVMMMATMVVMMASRK